MNTKKNTAGKILLHGTGAGGITEKDVERRARELASINGRSESDPSRKDVAQAKRELTGEDLPPTTDDDSDASIRLTRDPSEPPSDPGHQTPDIEDPDEQTTVERLTEEGVEEAQHEQMLAAQRRDRRENRGV